MKVASAAGGKSKGGNTISKSTMKPVVHQDSWFLRFLPSQQEIPSTAPPVVRWERRKRPANSPNPPRAGATQAFHKGRGILFGGVHDVEESEEGIDSEFFNVLFVWNVERNRFFPLNLRRAKAPPKKQAGDRDRRGKAKADEAELLRNLAALETKGSIKEAEKMALDLSEEEEPSSRPEKPVLDAMPHPRFNSQLAVQGDTLYIFGGTYEQGDREFTFADLYSIDLGRLNGVQEIYRRELENWQEEEAESESENGEDAESEDEDSEGEAGTSGVALPTGEAPPAKEEPATVATKEEEVDEIEQNESSIVDNRPHPRPFESLREYFTRTSQAWQESTLEAIKDRDPTSSQSVKELRRIAFESAENCWWDFREEVTAEEERQEEAGIGEVVNIADRANGGEGSNRRR